MSILLSHITKAFARGGQSVLNDVSLEIEDGELFVLLGASGSGKSTLLRLIAGLTALDAGTISLHGREVTTVPTQKRGIGFVFQNYSLFQHMTAAQNIAFGLEMQRMPRPQRDQRVAELLDLIGMGGMGDRLPTQLSGGQQQRIALARALAPEPEVLLLDEPFGALDVKIRGQLRQNLREIQQRLHVTTILVTHDQEEAFELADRIGIIEAGQLLEVGTPDALYRQPQHPFTAAFLGTANLMRGQRNGTSIHVDDLRLPAPPNTDHLSGQTVDVLLRPESVTLALNADDLDGEILGRGVIVSMTFAGAFERLTVNLTARDQTVQVLLPPDRARALNVRPGDSVWVGVRDYHLLPVQPPAEPLMGQG